MKTVSCPRAVQETRPGALALRPVCLWLTGCSPLLEPAWLSLSPC